MHLSKVGLCLHPTSVKPSDNPTELKVTLIYSSNIEGARFFSGWESSTCCNLRKKRAGRQNTRKYRKHETHSADTTQPSRATHCGTDDHPCWYFWGTRKDNGHAGHIKLLKMIKVGFSSVMLQNELKSNKHCTHIRLCWQQISVVKYLTHYIKTKGTEF